MTSSRKEQVLFFGSIGVLFLLIISLFTLLVLQESGRNKLLSEYEASKAASALLELYARQESLTDRDMGANVLGFGIYAFDGRRILAKGTAPDSLAVEESMLSRASVEKRGRVLRIVRPIGVTQGLGGGQGMMRNRQRMSMMGRIGALLFLEYDVSSYSQGNTFMLFMAVFMPLSLAGVLFAIVHLYVKNRQLRAKEASQRELVKLGEAARTLAHEIKNPLGIIRIQCGTLKKLLPEKDQRHVQVIDDEVSRLSVLVERIGEFLRNPQGTPVSIDLTAFLKDLITRFDYPVVLNAAHERPIHIVFDQNRLRSVFENLIRNAHESMEGKDEPVEIGVEEGKHWIRASVFDRGSGLSPDDRDRVFDPFFTTKPTGSGIGLAITKRFMEAMGGSVELQQRHGGGVQAVLLFKRPEGI